MIQKLIMSAVLVVSTLAIGRTQNLIGDGQGTLKAGAHMLKTKLSTLAMITIVALTVGGTHEQNPTPSLVGNWQGNRG